MSFICQTTRSLSIEITHTLINWFFLRPFHHIKVRFYQLITSLSLLFRMPRTKSVRFLSNIRSKFPLTFFRAIFTSLQYEYRLFSFPLIRLFWLSKMINFDYSFTFYIHTCTPKHTQNWFDFLFPQKLHVDSIIKCTKNHNPMPKAGWYAKNKRKSVWSE